LKNVVLHEGFSFEHVSVSQRKSVNHKRRK